MHTANDHSFGQDQIRPGEARTRVVIAVTFVMMVVEISAGFVYGSMALLADGLHMGSHAAALLIAAFAYWYARKHARDPRYTFGTGKVNALGGFAGAVLLAVFAGMMAIESAQRILNPVAIAFDQAILVAIIGLVVNAVCALILGGHGHGHAHDHGHAHTHSEDHNLRSAYLHVIADALTSVLAIVALIAGKFGGWNWFDPGMGILGAVLVGRWSISLMRESSRSLLDEQAPEAELAHLREALEDAHTRVTDVHVWAIGPGIRAAALTIDADAPGGPDAYRARIPASLHIVHSNIEIHSRDSVTEED